MSRHDTITLGHGSGGTLTHELLDRYIIGPLSNPLLDRQHDGAILDLQGPLAFTTDSFVVQPLFFPGGDIGSLAVHGTVNDIAMCGAYPQYLSLSLILEEGLPLVDLERILQSIQRACREAGVQIVTGDTKVVEKGSGDGIFINTTGIGRMHPKARIGVERLAVGDMILVSGTLANHGITIMSQREGLSFASPIESDSQAVHEPVLALLDELGDAVKLLRDPTRGGVGTVLNEIAKQSGLGVQLDAESIPVRPTVNGACEMLGLDPLLVANEGLFIAVIDQAIAEKAIALLKDFPASAEVTPIGEIVAAHPAQVVSHNAMGGKRVVPMLPGEQLPRIC